ncbi:MAG: NINE protein [Solobacterium sp.]|nr:NINE protein [Solobacterium sp.]
MAKKNKTLKKGKKATPLNDEQIDELFKLESELSDLKRQYHIEDKSWFARLGDRYYAFREAHTVLNQVNRKTYLWLCLLAVLGINQFYARHWVKGLFYLALSWTGIPVAFGLIDWMIALPKQADENGNILI